MDVTLCDLCESRIGDERHVWMRLAGSFNTLDKDVCEKCWNQVLDALGEADLSDLFAETQEEGK